MNIKYYNLKIIFCGMVLWRYVYRKYIWWITLQTGDDEIECTVYYCYCYSCSYHPEDDHMIGRNVSVLSM